MRAMQRTLFHAKSAKNDLKPKDFLKHNFYFETEGVCCKDWRWRVLRNHVEGW